MTPRLASRPLALGVLLLALPLAACTAFSSAQAATTSSPGLTAGTSADLAKFYGQQLVWKSCDKGYQCSRLSVPLNYAEPSGATIQIAVVRKPATNRAQRLGSLVVNPGGPGGSGISYATSGDVLDSSLTARYDLVGFDPRGVGQSNPVQCLTDSQMDQFVDTPSNPDTPAELVKVQQESQLFAQQCEAKSGSLLPHIGTVDAARDMDILRAALGDKQLNYLGKSYGTLLGATYAQEFPQRVGRFVLDGAIDPNLTAEQENLTQAEAFDKELHLFLADCVKQSNCPMGTTDPNVAFTKLENWVTGLEAHPITGDGTRMLDQAYALTGISVAMYDQTWWPTLRQALTSAFKGSGATLLAMADAYNDRENGRFVDNEIAANYAVNCVDHPDEATSVAQIQASLPTFEKDAPFFGPMVDWSSLPCAYWKASATDSPHTIAARGAGPIIVVGTTNDPATPYSWAQGLAKELASGRLLTMNGDGHTAYRRGSTCIDGAVDAYYLTGALPTSGTVCQQTS
ncbi:alpha/beta hydrolase [Actinospica sp.]|uniref:alpha/beta hydrolase n=1 Tax=Actinospica sp. TaxID=1872142 RepID=UPI002BE12D26|nr:alpha/beta hydrolase [Actinospica sp.]HWG23745.1 alpha/beta hydrolase [Actinospica sp.]